MEPMLQHVRRIGQSLLLRAHILQRLRIGCQADAQLLFQTLSNFNRSFVNDFKYAYQHPDQFNEFSAMMRTDNAPNNAGSENDELSELLGEATSILEAAGLDDPVNKVYVTSHPLEGLPELCAIFVIYWIAKVL